MSGHRKWNDLKAEREVKKFDVSNLPGWNIPLPRISLEELTTDDYWKFNMKEFGWHWIRRWKFKKERAKYGYATQDWWSFDTYLATVIAHGLERFTSEESMGHPGDRTAEEWHEQLHKIAEPLKKWACEDRWKLAWEEEQKLYTQVQDSIRQLAEIFGHLWD